MEQTSQSKLEFGDEKNGDEISYSELLDETELKTEEYQESVENKALREAIEVMVSNALPREENEDADDYNDIVVLSPDHPMLKSFHNSVETHLRKQKNHVLNDILELTANVKAKRNEADDKAENLYAIQQTLSRQRLQIALKSDNLVNDSDVRQELDTRIKSLRDQQKEEVSNVAVAQNIEEKLWRILNDITQKEYQARVKKETEDSKLSVVQRITEKAHTDKKLLADEKKKQDEQVYRLICEVNELQSKLNQLDLQLQAKRKDESRIKQATSSAAEDLMVQNEEYLKLMQAWQRLLINAQIKEQAHAKLQAHKMAAEEEIKILEVEIEGFRKGGAREMERNERLTLCVKHLERDHLTSMKLVDEEKQKVEDEHIQLASVNTMLKLTEEDLTRAKQVTQQTEEKKNILDKEIAITNKEQLKLEQKLFEAINEQASKDNAVQYAIKQVEKLQKELEDWTVQLSHKESTASALGLDVQRQRFQNTCADQLLHHNQALVDTAQNQLRHINLELQHAQTELVAQQSVLDRFNKQLNKLLSKTGGKEIPIVQLKIKDMEENLKEIVSEIDVLQKKLLKKEMRLLETTKNHSKLKRDVEECQKYLSYMRKKSLAQNNELELACQQEAILKKKTEETLHALALIDNDHSKLKTIKETLENENLFAYKDIIAFKKEEEQQVQNLRKRLEQLGQERVQLHEALGELQRQQVDVEAKVTLAAETKQAIEKERGSNGEIAALKSEIHRMEVRLGQLKRTQERLTLDLDQCVLRRDAMVDSARARNTRTSGSSTTFMKVIRKLENLLHSNKQMLNKIQQLRIESTSFTILENEIKTMEEGLSTKQKEINLIKEPIYASDAKVHSLRIRKKQNLEQLIHEQKRCRGLSDAKDGKYKPTHRTEIALSSEAERQRVTRANILSVIESLRPDFPNLNTQLSAISVLLKSIKVAYIMEQSIQEESNEGTQN